MDADKYDVLPIYISKDNEFYIGDELFDLANYSDIVKDPSAHLSKVTIYKDGNSVKVRPVKGIFKKEVQIDVAFPVVHGTNVEDGSLAGFLQMLDIPYTSCDVLGGALGQDKAAMKDVFKAQGIWFYLDNYPQDDTYLKVVLPEIHEVDVNNARQKEAALFACNEITRGKKLLQAYMWQDGTIEFCTATYIPSSGEVDELDRKSVV